ncbi:MAG: type VI secretion system contractile sheath large subunit [Candidatus Sedimenticola sp. (ex Thyasira tokunagai)]
MTTSTNTQVIEFINQVFYSFNLINTEQVKDVSGTNTAALLMAKKQNCNTQLQLASGLNSYQQAIATTDDIEGFKNKLAESLNALMEITLQDGALLALIDSDKIALGITDGGEKETALTELAKIVVDSSAIVTAIAELVAVDDFTASDAKTACFIHLANLEGVINQIKSDETFSLRIDETEMDSLLMQISALSNNQCLPHNDGGELSASDLLYYHKCNIDDCIGKIDQEIQCKLDEELHKPDFQGLEGNWRALEYLIDQTDFSKGIKIDLLDVTKQELADDFAENRRDISNSQLFKKIYTHEYDQYGGEPYGLMVGLFEFENTNTDISWLTTMGQISKAAHCPFISSVGPQFFVNANDINQLVDIKDLVGHMAQSKFAKWNEFRDSSEAAYLGFTVPRFMVRRPYSVEDNPVVNLSYTETVDSHEHYSWANAAMLFARNVVQSYESTSWCQTIRGPKNGGQINNLPRHIFDHNGLTMTKSPVEIVFPDYRELDFSTAGFIPLVYQKETGNACFFSSQSIKKSKCFKDSIDTENSQLVTNLSYTLSITIIAHYIKCIMRDNIGGTADASYINDTISNWLSNYVTTVANPDDLTLRSYPFKAISVETVEQEGSVGWYNCIVKVSPHRQFEGLDVELRLETQL